MNASNIYSDLNQRFFFQSFITKKYLVPYNFLHKNHELCKKFELIKLQNLLPTYAVKIFINIFFSLQGDRLDEKNLIITDADDTITNSYSVRILDDPFNVLNLTFDIFPLVDHPKIKNIPHSTVIVASEK